MKPTTSSTSGIGTGRRACYYFFLIINWGDIVPGRSSDNVFKAINDKIPELVAGAVPVAGTSDATLLSKIDDMTALLEIIAEELDV